MPAILLAGDFFAGGAAEDRFLGGWHWQAAAASLSEGRARDVRLAVGDRVLPGRTTTICGPWRGGWRPPAYGAFIVHPPVLVGLALAIQPAPVPAELKFACVLAGGVALSFELAALAGRIGPVARVLGAGPRPAPELPSTVQTLEVSR